MNDALDPLTPGTETNRFRRSAEVRRRCVHGIELTEERRHRLFEFRLERAPIRMTFRERVTRNCLERGIHSISKLLCVERGDARLQIEFLLDSLSRVQ